MELLVIGGTSFSGRALAEQALEAGHRVTVFHRTPNDVVPQAEHVLGDRDQQLDALAGRTFDAVVDMCGYVPRAVRASTTTLATSGWYGFVSSISAHVDGLAPGATEESATHEPPFPDTEDVTEETYGPLKVACELVVKEAFGDRPAVIRPGYIVGPHDPTDRLHLMGPSSVRRWRDARAGPGPTPRCSSSTRATWGPSCCISPRQRPGAPTTWCTRPAP